MTVPKISLKLGDTDLIIAEAAKQGLLRNELAYVLATGYWESAHTMQPIMERGGTKYLMAKEYWPYVGRGYVQLTWKYNYELASKKLGVDFVAHPEQLLQSRYAVPILVIGMKEGWFTGKKLSNYFSVSKSDYINARRMINKMDKAKDIADIAVEYNRLLLAAGYGVHKLDDLPAADVAPVAAKPAAAYNTPNVWDWLKNQLSYLFMK